MTFFRKEESLADMGGLYVGPTAISDELSIDDKNVYGLCIRTYADDMLAYAVQWMIQERAAQEL